MSITTTEPLVACSRCSDKVDKYYYELGFDGVLCYKCLLEINEGEFPDGKGCYLPCGLCKSPTINWYEEESYNENPNNNCGNHKQN